MDKSNRKPVFGVVYAVTHRKEPERVRYYGQTTGTVRRRRQGHYDTVRAGVDLPISRWLRKYYEEQEDVLFTVVRKCYSREELDETEIALITEGRGIGQCDLNISAGGGGLSGVPNTEAQKEKIRNKLKGEGTWKHKLTWELVRKIRERHASGETIRDISRDYPVAECNIGQIVRNRTWVDPEYTPKRVTQYRKRMTPLEAKSRREEVLNSTPQTFRHWSERWGLDIGSTVRLLRNESHFDPDFDASQIRTLTFAEAQSGVTWERVREVRRDRIEKWEPNVALSEKLGLSTSAVSRMLRNGSFYDPEFDPARLAKKPT